MKKTLFIAITALVALSSCEKDKEDKGPKEKIFKSAVAKFQHGKAWTTYEINDKDEPVRLAIVMDSAAMNSLDRNTGEGGHHHENSLSLKLHSKAVGPTPFNHVLLDWNPKGHEPEPIYGKPHFDFHFYIQSEAERIAIPTFEADSTGFVNRPGPAYIPANYINPSNGTPKMGSHWLDVTSPELSGAPFGETFIYGSYKGKVTFWEPMITEKFILDNPNFQRNVPQPAKYQVSGWYPTKMRIEKKAEATQIILEGFVKRQAS